MLACNTGRGPSGNASPHTPQARMSASRRGSRDSVAERGTIGENEGAKNEAATGAAMLDKGEKISLPKAFGSYVQMRVEQHLKRTQNPRQSPQKPIPSQKLAQCGIRAKRSALFL
ncbi:MULTISPECIES: hypothetical protein [Paraburkholderia]|nr:hypothetical protein [Paraburkholderia tropica]MBB3002236.1 hypothetical protein [Paraburkholderia tropica]MBB6321619.1 hypothetical protein [Paraburkholderia tropica]